jgi:hypothetical protein
MGEAALLVAVLMCALLVLLLLLQARMWQASLVRATLAEVGSTGCSTAAEIFAAVAAYVLGTTVPAASWQRTLQAQQRLYS